MFKLLTLLLIACIHAEPLYMNYQVQEDYVPIIGYHKIEEIFVYDFLTTTIDNFREQVAYLSVNMSCNWITMERLAYYVEKGEKLPTNSCIMNFDDGALNQYENTLCTLNEYKVPATYYIAVDNIESNKYYMDKYHVDELHKIGHDIESHTLSHPHLASLTIEEQEEEILGAKVKLEEWGYNITSFSYPFGEWNTDTLDILRDSTYTFARDTSQRDYWKDIRSPTISFTEDYLLHFFYFKPEMVNAEELYEIIKYTGWWQFEDNYEQIAGGEWDVTTNGHESVIPTDTSYGIVKLTQDGNEISRPFMTKYEGAFTLDMILYNETTTIDFLVKIDGIEYDVFAHEADSEYSLKYGITYYWYYNFYINIPHLSPGVHRINIVKIGDNTLYLDKFRLFSNVSQDFSYESYYKECDPSKSDYCTCIPDEVPFWDKFFTNLRNSSLLLGITILIVGVMICFLYACFNCNKKPRSEPLIEEEEEEEEMV